MPSWKLHEKWCKALGISEEICREINRIIDSPPHDVVDNLLRWNWARMAFESGKLREPIHIVPGDDYEKVTRELAEITNRFGVEGIKATFSHIALDRVAELIELGFDKEEIKRKLIENDLMKYIPDYDQVFADVSNEVKPSEQKIKWRKEFEGLAKSGVYGMFYIDGKYLPAAAGLIQIKSKIKKGKSVYVKWGIDADEARKGRIKKNVSNEKDLEELIRVIRGF